MKKLFKEIDKKLLISFIIIITMLSTFAIYKIFATTVTSEMSEEGEHTLINDGTWLSLTELDSWYDLFCSEKGTHLPSEKNATVTAGGRSSVEGRLTQKDIGKQLFRVNLTARNSSPYTGGPFTNETYGYYNEETYTTTPKASYIIAEMINNIGKHQDSYVQIAWWTTEEGHLGANVEDNNLSREADAFQEYILKVAEVSNVNNLSYTNTPTKALLEEKYSKYIENGIVKFKFPDIEYKPKWNYEVVGGKDFSNITFEEVTTSWDSPEQVYKIGPFSIDYIESLFKVTENGSYISDRNYDEANLIEWNGEKYVQFSGIESVELYTNASDKPLIRRDDPTVTSSDKNYDWEFIWIRGQRDKVDDAEFPHQNEEFYIKMKYIPGATEITDFAFNFRYMNAGGEYQKLTGSYSKATWEAKSKEYFETYYCGSENCSGHRRYVSTDYWIQLTSLQKIGPSQTLGAGIIGCRWYEKARLSMNIEINENEQNKGKLSITKQIVDENGNKLNISENDFFEFKIHIDGQFWRSLRVQAGDTVETPWYYWDEGKPTPQYEVSEVHMSNGYEEYRIENATGTLKKNGTVKVIAKNKQVEDKSGYLKIDKKVYGNITNKEFKFKVTIGDKTYEPIISAATGWTWTSDKFTWSGNNNPKYTVSEYETSGVNTVTINPSSGYLKDGTTVTVTAINEKITEWEKGKIEIIKKLQEKISISGTYTFKINVEGYGTFYEYIEISAGQTSSSKTIGWLYWEKGTTAPRYTVEEVNIPEGSQLINITNSSGSMVADGTISVTALNKAGGTDDKDHSGYLKIDKKAYGNIQNLEFKFRVTIGSKTYEPVISEATGWTWTSEKFTWKGDNAPQYTVQEIDIPQSAKLVGITPSSGKLADTEGGNITTVTAINEKKTEWEYGKIEITKKLDGNSVSSDTYTFKITVEGYSTFYATVKAGSTYRSQQFAWEKGTTAPKYTVEEVDIPSGSQFVSITNSQGSLSASETVSVIAINKLEEKSGKIKVTKEAITDEKMQNEAINEKFTINIQISGTFEMNGESVVGGARTLTATLSAGGTYETPTIKWWGNNSPTYTVTETDIPKGWILDGISNSKGTVSEGETIDVIVTNSFKTRIVIDLTMEMAGKVWEDEYSNDKPPVLNGKWDDNEKGIDGVEVYVYKVLYSGGTEVNRYLATGYETDGETEIPWPLLTQNGGHWDAPRMSVPALKDEEKTAKYEAKYDIEFVYDGQTYEPTTFLPTSSGNSSEYMSASTSKRDAWLKDSMALDYNREEVDNRIGEVAGDKPIDSNGDTIGKVKGINGESSIQYTSTDYTYGANNSSRKVSKVITTDGNGVALEIFKAKARTSTGGLLYPFDDRIHLESVDKMIDELGAVQIYHYSATYEYTKNINLGLVKRELADVAATKDLYDANVVVNEKLLNYRFNKAFIELAEKMEDEEMAYNILNKQIEIQDASIEYTLGLYESDYYYRAAIYEQDSELYGILKGFYDKNLKLPLESTELDIYLTYKISLYNESSAYEATINEVEDYFDSSFTLVNTTVHKYIQTANGVTIDGVTEVANPSKYSVARQTTSGIVNDSEIGNVEWKIVQSNIKGSDGTTYNKMSTQSLKDIKLSSGEKIDIYVTFSVNKADHYDESASTTVSNCIMLGAKNNVVEIANYTTYYSKTYHSEKEGEIAGKIDKDSAPSNVNLEQFNEKSWYEDDADAAPILNIKLYTEDRQINGLAWEDGKDTQIANGYGQIVGNGKREENEYLIGDLTTELVEKIRVIAIDDSGNPITDAGKYVYKEYDFIWPTDKTFDFLGGVTLEKLTGFKSKVATAKAAADGLEEGQYSFTSVPAGNYVVRFTYGDKEIETAGYKTNSPVIYNGQDYKTTTYQSGFESITDADGDGYPDNEWHDLTNTELLEAKVSDAKDDEARRLDVVAKSRIMTNVNGTILATADDLSADHTDLYEYYMTSDTAKLNLELENTNAIKNQLLSDGSNSLITNNIENQYVIGGVIVNSIAGKVNINGVEKGTEDFTYIVGNIDIGLIERASTELTLDKQIETIKLTTSDNKTILYAEYNIEYDLKYNEVIGNSTWEADVNLDKNKSFGIDHLQSLNKIENKKDGTGTQNFRYINVDETILQGTTIQIGYLLTVLDTGEVDRTGLLETLVSADEIIEQAETLREISSTYKKAPRASEFDKKIICGEYLGTIYYQGANSDSSIDSIVTTKVHQLIDYIDNDAVFTAALNTGVDASWRNITVEEINDDKLLDISIYMIEQDGETIAQIIDKNGVGYETENRNNIVVSVKSAEDDIEYTNKGFIVDLVPYSAIKNGYTRYGYMTEMRLATTRYISQETDANDMNFDNIAEIIIFENTVGRRDIEAVPGNADPKLGEFYISLSERDSSATEIITLTPPTGINKIDIMRIQLLLASLVALIIVTVGIVIIKKKVLK